MYLLLRLTPIFSSLFILLMLLILLQPGLWLGVFGIEKSSIYLITILAALCFLCLLGTMIIIGMGLKLKVRLRFLPFSILFLTSVFAICLFSDSVIFLIALLTITPIILWAWHENIYLFWQHPFRYQAYTLERLANYFYLLNLFLFIYALTGIQILLQIPFWAVLIVAASVFMIIQYDLFMLHKLQKQKSLFFSLIGTIMGLEALMINNLLPTQFLFYGLSIMLLFYIWLGVGKQYLENPDAENKGLTYILIGGIGFIASYITSFWIR